MLILSYYNFFSFTHLLFDVKSRVFYMFIVFYNNKVLYEP